jgi:hypothetical protein
MATTATALKDNYSIEALKSAIVDYKNAKFIRFKCVEHAPDAGLTFETKIERMLEFKTEGPKTVVMVEMPNPRIASFKFLERKLIVVKEGDEEQAFQGAERATSRRYRFHSLTLLALEIYRNSGLPEGTVVKLSGREIDYTPSLRH